LEVETFSTTITYSQNCVKTLSLAKELPQFQNQACIQIFDD